MYEEGTGLRAQGSGHGAKRVLEKVPLLGGVGVDS